jgi:acyl transferase domain-containing protein
MGKVNPTAPSPRGQAAIIKRAWKDAGMSVRKLVYAE